MTPKLSIFRIQLVNSIKNVLVRLRASSRTDLYRPRSRQGLCGKCYWPRRLAFRLAQVSEWRSLQWRRTPSWSIRQASFAYLLDAIGFKVIIGLCQPQQDSFSRLWQCRQQVLNTFPMGFQFHHHHFISQSDFFLLANFDWLVDWHFWLKAEITSSLTLSTQWLKINKNISLENALKIHFYMWFSNTVFW